MSAQKTSFSYLNLTNVTAMLCCLFSICLLVWAFARGFDFTDEASTILSAEQPFAETVRSTEYAFYTHFLYQLSGEHLFFFRLYGLVLFLLGNAYFAVQLVKLLVSSKPGTADTSACASLAVWISIVCYYCKWYPSPNYYSVCLLGMVLAAGATLHILRLRHTQKFNPLLFVALGLALSLAALGRATSAAVMAIPITIVILWGYRSRPRQGIAGLAVVGITGIAALLLHMSFIAEGVEPVLRIYHSLLFTPDRLGDAGYEASSMFKRWWEGEEELRHALWTQRWLFMTLTTLAVLTRIPRSPMRHCPNGLLLILLASQVRWLGKNYGDPSEVVTTMFFMVLTALIFAFFTTPPFSQSSPKRTYVAGGLLLAFLSWALAFGSNVPMLWQASRGAVFIAAGILCVTWGMGNANLIRGISVLLCAATFAVVLSATLTPYHQAPLREHTCPIALRGAGTEIKVWPEAATYIHTLRSAAAHENWKIGTALLDLSGGNAGIAYLLNAKIAGFSRVCGGYGKSSDVGAQQIIDSFSPADRARAWIVTSDDPRRISDEVLARNFPGFPHEYKKVVELPSMSEKIAPRPTEIVWRPLTAVEK